MAMIKTRGNLKRVLFLKLTMVSFMEVMVVLLLVLFIIISCSKSLTHSILVRPQILCVLTQTLDCIKYCNKCPSKYAEENTVGLLHWSENIYSFYSNGQGISAEKLSHYTAQDFFGENQNN